VSNFEGATKAYGEALSILPKHELTEPRREAGGKQVLRADRGLAKRDVVARYHIVREGETLEQIASQFGVEVAALREANRLDGDSLQTSQILLVPLVEMKPARTEELLKTIVLAGIDMKDTPLVSAIAALQEEILRLYDSGLFPDASPIFLLDVPEKTLNTKVTLRLANVIASEACAISPRSRSASIGSPAARFEFSRHRVRGSDARRIPPTLSRSPNMRSDHAIHRWSNSRSIRRA